MRSVCHDEPEVQRGVLHREVINDPQRQGGSRGGTEESGTLEVSQGMLRVGMS